MKTNYVCLRIYVILMLNITKWLTLIINPITFTLSQIFFFVLPIHLVHFCIKCFYLTCSNMSFLLSNKFLNDTSINLSFTMPSFKSLIDDVCLCKVILNFLSYLQSSPHGIANIVCLYCCSANVQYCVLKYFHSEKIPALISIKINH